MYVDNCIIIGKNMSAVDSFIDSLKEGHEEFDLTDEGSTDKYPGVLFRDIDEISKTKLKLKKIKLHKTIV